MGKRVRCKEEPVDEERREASGTQETYLHAHKRIKLEAEAQVDGGLQHQGESHVGDPKSGNSNNYPSEEGEVDKVKEEVKDEVKDEVKKEIKEEVKEEVKEEIKEEVKEEVKEEAKEEVKDEVKEEVKEEIKEEVK